MNRVPDAIAVVDRGLDALERGDVEGFARVLEEGCRSDYEFSSAIDTALGGAPLRGAAQIKAWFADLLETADEVHWRERRYEALGPNAFLVLTRFEMKGRASGVPTETQVGQVYELDERGLISRSRSYASHAEARQAARGLRDRADTHA